MKGLISAALVAALFAFAALSPGWLPSWVLGIAIPYLALTVFAAGLIHRVLGWLVVPVPFRIPTTCGQQRTLPWLPRAKLDNPHTRAGVLGRMALEVLCFRSLLRNTEVKMTADRRLVYATDLRLWLASMAMHWSLAVILVRHLRFLTRSVLPPVQFLESVDGFMEVGLPVFYLSSVAFLVSAAYLLYRRFGVALVRYISLPGDYFALFLLLGIGLSGFWLRHLERGDVMAVKELALGLAGFAPVVPDGISPLFLGHLFLVSVLLAYFPFSKLVHMAGVFLSPTRNQANSNREVRHVNPWDHPVHIHTYAEYEDELRDKMVAAGIPVDKKE